MKRYKIVITPNAAQNLCEAHEWLFAENPIYAAKWLDGVRDKILELETLPESHAEAPESRSFDCEIRILFYGRGTPLRIFFGIEELTVHILHVRHASRDDWKP